VTHRLNLARRPFVDTRSVNVVAGILALLVLVGSVVSLATVRSYLAGSKKTREAIASLRDEAGKLDAERATVEASLARIDLVSLAAGAEDANALARTRLFSWTRFLTRLEEVLPEDSRVTQVSLTRSEATATGTGMGPQALKARQEAASPSAAPPGSSTPGAVDVQLSLVTRDRDGLPRVIRALYASRWFDRPEPSSEQGPDKGVAEGTTLLLKVGYVDAGKKP
jgi:Tfp pilus assembly protein PilN